MTDQGNEPTRADTEPVGGPHDPTVVGIPPVGPEAETGRAGEGPPPGSPPPPWGPDERPDRRPWIIIALLVLLLLAAVLLFFALRDDDDGDGDSTTTSSETTSTTEEETTTSEDTTTTTEATTSTTGATTSTTAGGSPPVTADPAQCREAGADAGNPDPAAQAVFIAWTRGDEACARELMDDAAFDELFGRDGTDATDDFQGCTEQADPEPHMDCAFTYEGGSTHYLMRFSPTDGWRIFEVTQVAD